MKSMFADFYKPTQEQFEHIWDNSMFVYDTNVLLNLHRYSEETKNTFLNIMDELKERSWIPHQVGLEYNYNMYGVMIELQNSFTKLMNKLVELRSGTEESLNKFLALYERHPVIKPNDVLEQVISSFTGAIQNINTIAEDYKAFEFGEEINNKLSELFEGKIGSPYSEDQLKQIIEDGKMRYAQNVPPGYKDSGKDGVKYYDFIPIQEKYGDLIVWYQIIEKAQVERKNVIFVTGDLKEDWWRQEKGRTLGPRIELMQEFKKKTNFNFYMYTPPQFMRYAQEHIDRTKEDDQQEIGEAIEEVEAVYAVEDKQKNHELSSDVLQGLLQNQEASSNTVSYSLEKLQQQQYQGDVRALSEALAKWQQPQLNASELSETLAKWQQPQLNASELSEALAKWQQPQLNASALSEALAKWQQPQLNASALSEALAKWQQPQLNASALSEALAKWQQHQGNASTLSETLAKWQQLYNQGKTSKHD